MLRPLLFALPPEASHDLALTALAVASRSGAARWLPAAPADPAEVMGLAFRNRLGLAAGLDKNARAVEALAGLGFGFVEVGTVTPRPQPGNPAPRMFRLVEDEALINRMGFNNDGVDAVRRRLQRARPWLERRGIVLGVNIGKNRDTPITEAARDYLAGMDALYPLADYLTVNLSSPNTPGLRSLQSGDAFTSLVATLKDRQAVLDTRHGRHVKLVVKVAPDLDLDAEVPAMASVLIDLEVDAVIVANTTVSRAGDLMSAHRNESGGLSGRPLAPLTLGAVAAFARALDGRMPVIGAGGITDAAGVRAMRAAGASLVQVYTGFIYHGPGWVRRLARGPGRRPGNNASNDEKNGVGQT